MWALSVMDPEKGRMLTWIPESAWEQSEIRCLGPANVPCLGLYSLRLSTISLPQVTSRLFYFFYDDDGKCVGKPSPTSFRALINL